MAVSVEWEIKGTEFANCNCIYACPCQFNALPDKGFCEAVVGYQIDAGTFRRRPAGWPARRRDVALAGCGASRVTAACNSSSMSARTQRSGMRW